MKEITGNIFDVKDADAICVPTNGVVKANGELVMGAGLAKQFADRYPELARHLGKQTLKYRRSLEFYDTSYPEHHSCVQVFYTWDFDGGWRAGIEEMESEWLSTHPNQVSLLDSTDPKDVALVKQMSTPQPHVVAFPTKEHYKNPSTLQTIERSTEQLERLTTNEGWKKVVLPRVGCSLGQLDWMRQVKPILERILDDRFYIIA